MTLGERRGIDVEVYEPAEDSGLLASVATEHVRPGDRVLDVGTGSGYVAASIEEAVDARVVGSDVNPEACRRALDRGVEAVRADLVSPFRDGAFDVVTFNPPYLPEVEGATWDDWFEVALSGGKTGREVIERFLDDAGRVLSPDGFVLLLASSLSGVDEVATYAGRRGFSTVAVSELHFPGETLTILKLLR